MEARAVVRLLIRGDDLSPALYMETIYYSSHADPALERQASTQESVCLMPCGMAEAVAFLCSWGRNLVLC